MSISVIGCGYWGKNLIRNFYELNELSSVCDTSEELAGNFAKKYEVAALTFDEVLSSNCKGVVIALPAFLHSEYAIKALEAGKHVYVEKPLAMNLEEADKMIVAANLNKRKLMVGHLLQYHPIFQKIKELCFGGEIGNINYIYSNRLSLGKVRSEEDVLWSFAPHDISMILSICNSEIKTIYCHSSKKLQNDISDSIICNMSFQNGLEAHIFCSWMNPFKEHKLVIVGTEGMIVFDDTLEWNKKLCLYRHVIDTTLSPPAIEKSEPDYVTVDEKEPLKEECSHFIDVVNNDIEPFTDGNEGKRVLNALNMASKSLIKKEVIKNA